MTLEKLAWWDEKNDCHFCGEYNEAFEIFLTEKYGSDDKSN
jgi:hypothetical protein